MIAIVASIFIPELITPFAQGVPMTDVGDGLLDGMKQYKFMRAFYGLVVSGTIAVFVTLLTKPEPFEKQRGLVWGTIEDALKNYKGSPGDESAYCRTTARPRQSAVEPARAGTAQLPVVNLSRPAAEALNANCGDLVYVSDRRWWLGGLRSTHAVVGAISVDGDESIVEIGPQTWSNVVTNSRPDELVSVERLY